MNAARRRIKQFRERLAKQRLVPEPKQEFVSPLAKQLHDSIEQIKAQHFEKFEVAVHLKGHELVFAWVDAKAPTAALMQMQRQGFWTVHYGLEASPMFVMPGQIERAWVFNAK